MQLPRSSYPEKAFDKPRLPGCVLAVRLPDDQQESKYVGEVKRLIKSSLGSACWAYYWRDENILLCELPEDTPPFILVQSRL